MPSSTHPTSRTRIGRPSRMATIVFSTSTLRSNSPMARIRTSRPVSSMSPAETLRFSRDRALVTSLGVIPSAAMRSAASWTWISRTRPPWMSTEATPGSRSSRRLIVCSAMWRTWRASPVPDRPRKTTGMSERLNLNRVGSDASSGSMPRTKSSCSRMSFTTSFRSTPQSNWAWMLLMPSADMEFNWSRPVTEERACSTGLVIRVSISSGATPS